VPHLRAPAVRAVAREQLISCANANKLQYTRHKLLQLHMHHRSQMTVDASRPCSDWQHDPHMLTLTPRHPLARNSVRCHSHGARTLPVLAIAHERVLPQRGAASPRFASQGSARLGGQGGGLGSLALQSCIAVLWDCGKGREEGGGEGEEGEEGGAAGLRASSTPAAHDPPGGVGRFGREPYPHVSPRSRRSSAARPPHVALPRGRLSAVRLIDCLLFPSYPPHSLPHSLALIFFMTISIGFGSLPLATYSSRHICAY